MNNFNVTLIGIFVILTFVKGQTNSNNDLVHGEFVGFGEYNPNQPKISVGHGTTNARPGGRVHFHPLQRPPPLNGNELNNDNRPVNENGLIRGRFPGFTSNINQMSPNQNNNVPTSSSSLQSTTFISCMANCPTTNEYNPVCGDDNQTYSNQWRLNCANKCGRNVAIIRTGACQ